MASTEGEAAKFDDGLSDAMSSEDIAIAVRYLREAFGMSADEVVALIPAEVAASSVAGEVRWMAGMRKVR